MSRISELVQTLHQKTMEKKMKWDFQDDSTISIHIGANSIFLTKDHDFDLGDIYKISVMNTDGNTVDSSDFHSKSLEYTRISEIIVRARRDALHADETLDDIMERISKM